MRQLLPVYLYEIDIVYSDEDEAFVATVPVMPFVGAHGETHEEALKMAKAAISAYLRKARKLNKPVPEPAATIR